MDDDIEILDIFNKKNNEVPMSRVSRLENKEKMQGSNNGEEKEVKKMAKKKKKLKGTAFQRIFCLVSAIFILGCIIFYGSRFIKYYKIYNPKVDSGDGSVLLAKDIVGKSEFATDDEDGLFSSSGNYIYRGDVKNNYLKYNNMLWRIVRINSDNSIDIILDDYISLLPWNNKVTSFSESEIYKYLNNEFLDLLDKEALNKTSFCTDKLSSLSSITCDDTNTDNYVKLLDVANFLNSVNKSKSYLVASDEIMWLADYSDEKIWHTNGSNVSQSLVNSFYEIRPMVRLKNTTIYSSGDGTKEKPFVVDKDNKITIGSRVKLGEDNWIVYDTKDNVRLMRETTLEKQIDFDKEKLSYKESSLMTYLNDTYLNSLSYKDMIIENTYDIGEYKDSIYDVKKDTVKTKVGIPNILDIKFDSKVKSYFTSTVNEERVLVYENPLRPGKVTTYRSMRPCITISKDTVNKLKYVDGIFKVGE
jgi:hypothetical protein